jgi:murein L,D-transpeptidase YafK
MKSAISRLFNPNGKTLCRMTFFILTLGAMVPVETVAAPPETDRAQQVAARIRPALERDLALQHLQIGAPVYLRIFQKERQLELWMRGTTEQYRLFRTYPICKFSGEPGPKQKEGDHQAPEGFYRVGLGELNPRSQFHLAFNLGYPNAYDRAHGYTGSALMVHGNCVSIGCYAMGDAVIEEIYRLAEAALRQGQAAFDVHVFPMHMTPGAMTANAASRWINFWKELLPAYTFFEHEHMPPTIEVRHGNYFVASSQSDSRR